LDYSSRIFTEPHRYGPDGVQHGHRSSGVIRLKAST
jgi:hypothetical protein